jgi:hypothetical protein
LASEKNLNRRGFVKTTTGGVLGLSAVAATESSAAAGAERAPKREAVAGFMTSRFVLGEPYDLLGKRIVFTNWTYVNPGGYDWVNEKGQSAGLFEDVDPFEAHFRGLNAPRGIRLRAYQPQIMAPLEKPPHRMILQDGGIYRGWSNNNYFESDDAINWKQKANCVLDEKIWDGIMWVFKDPIGPDSERYKFAFLTQISPAEFEEYRKRRPDGWDPSGLRWLEEEKKVYCIKGAVSPDGIDWKALPDPLSVEFSDTTIVTYYDQFLRKYVMYTRINYSRPRTDQLPPSVRGTTGGRRAIGRSESDDFRRFPPSELILEPTLEMLPSEVLYTNNKTTIPGAPDHHLMFPTVWNASVDDTTRIVMASSHDGIVWHWVPGGTLLETPAFGAPDGGCIWVGHNLIELPNGDWAIGYSGSGFPHKYPRGQRAAFGGVAGYAVWPKGRMMALEAQDRGQFTTVAIMPPGRELKINAETARAGSIRIQVEAAEIAAKGGEIDAQVIADRSFDECMPIFGDQHWTMVTWKGSSDLGYKPGEPIRLRFKLDRAKIFGLEFS